GNLSGSATAVPTYRLYRWENEAATPTQVFTGNPLGSGNGRWGDFMDARGSGINTEVLITSEGTQAVILRPTDDTMTGFTATTLNIAGIAAGDVRTVSFYTNNTFF